MSDTVRIQYDTGSDELYVPAFGILARRGIPVDVPADAAEGLLAQADVWRLAPKTTTKHEPTED